MLVAVHVVFLGLIGVGVFMDRRDIARRAAEAVLYDKRRVKHVVTIDDVIHPTPHLADIIDTEHHFLKGKPSPSVLFPPHQKRADYSFLSK